VNVSVSASQSFVLMTSLALSRFSRSHCVRRLRSALEVAVLAVLVVQLAAPVSSARADWEGRLQECEEEGEPAEESQADGEQIELMFTRARIISAQQPGVRLGSRCVVACASPAQ